AAPGDVIGEHRSPEHHQDMRVARALAHVAVRDAGAAAGLVDHRDVAHELVRREEPLQRACRAVVAAAGREPDHDLDVLLRRPGLGPARADWTEQCNCKQRAFNVHALSPVEPTNPNPAAAWTAEIAAGYCF